MPRSSSLFRRNLKWQFVANLTQALFGGLFLLSLGYFLGASDFGVYAVITAIMAVAGLTLEFRVQDLVAKDFATLADTPYTSRNVSPLVDLFLLELLSRIVPATLVILGSAWLVKVTGLTDEFAPLITVVAVGHVLAKTGNGLSTGLLRVLGRTDVLAGYVTADWAARLMVTSFFALAATLTVETALWISLAVGAAANIAQLWHALKILLPDWKSTLITNWSIERAATRLKNNCRLVLSNFGISLSDLMGKDLDVAMASYFLTADKVGLYKMAKSFVQVIWRAIDPVYLALMPEVQKLWAVTDAARLKTLIFRISLLLVPFSLVIVVISYVLLLAFIEPALGLGYAGVANLALAMFAWVIVCAPLVWGHPLAVAIGRPELAVLGSALGTLVGIASFSTLTALMGVNGAGLAWVLTLTSNFLFTAIASLYYARTSILVSARKPAAV